MLVKNVITIVQRIMFVNRKNAQLVAVIRMLIGLTDIFASHTRQKVRIRNELSSKNNYTVIASIRCFNLDRISWNYDFCILFHGK